MSAGRLFLLVKLESPMRYTAAGFAIRDSDMEVAVVIDVIYSPLDHVQFEILNGFVVLD